MKKIEVFIIVGVVLSLLLVGNVVAQEEIIQRDVSFIEEIYYNLLHTLKITGTYSIVGDYRSCDLNPEETFDYSQGQSIGEVKASSYCSSGHGLIDFYTDGWVPTREYKDEIWIGSCNVGPCHIEVYCCPHDECDDDNDCEDWYGEGSECERKTANDPNIDYQSSRFYYCDPKEMIQCWYVSDSTCEDRNYDSNLLDDCSDQTYMGKQLYNSKSECEGHIGEEDCDDFAGTSGPCGTYTQTDKKCIGNHVYVCSDYGDAGMCWTEMADCSLSGKTCTNGQCDGEDCHTGELGSMSYCTDSCKCGEGEGDCDGLGTDKQCDSGLICVKDVGANYGFSSGTDVCEKVGDDCTPHASKKCYNNDVYWYDSCGDREGKYRDCPHGCEGGQCKSETCTPHDSKKCYNNDVYWYDSCDSREEKQEECGALGCENGQCKEDTAQVVSFISDLEGKEISGTFNLRWENPGNTPVIPMQYKKGDCAFGTGWRDFLLVSHTIPQPDFTGVVLMGDVTSYRWDTTEFQDGNYCLRFQFGTDTVDITGIFKINNTGIIGDYVKHWDKECYSSDIYWYDNEGVRNDLYEDCGELGCVDGVCDGEGECIFTINEFCIKLWMLLLTGGIIILLLIMKK